MKKHADYRIGAEIQDDLPKIKIDIAYTDDFSDDHYALESMANQASGIQKIPFSLVKNGQKIGVVMMSGRDSKKFFSDVFSMVDDYDFKQEFYSKILSSLSDELNSFFEYFDRSKIASSFTEEGELKRMKRLSGMIH
jgi:hypothetical protein